MKRRYDTMESHFRWLGILLVGLACRGGIGAAAADNAVFETAHFHYRRQPPDRYIDSQRGNKAFAHADGVVYLSEDNGRSWPHSAVFPEAARITFSTIHERNGEGWFRVDLRRRWGSLDDVLFIQPK